MSALDDLFAPYAEHLKVAELAAILGVKESTAYRWLQEGKIPAYKPDGGTWMILRDEVREHVEKSRTSPPPEA